MPLDVAPLASEAPNPVLIPEQLTRELPPWLVEWAHEANRETSVLLANGAREAAASRCRLLVQFVEAAREWLDAEVDVTQAALAAGCGEETVRRWVRDGVIPDHRPGRRGRHRVRRGDLSALGHGYDPAADALNLAAQRNKP
jgi:excisionase family DNA binding protein